MKRALKFLSLVLLIALYVTCTVSCNKLKVTNLKANEHFKRANKYYTEEKWKRAVGEYESALQLNPKLDVIYKYLGTASAALYRPGDDSEENKAIGQKAQDALLKAQQLEPDDSKLTLALGQLSDKMRNFEEAEKQFLKYMERDPKNPDVYIILADFYKSYEGKQGSTAIPVKDKVLEMYDKRIALNPDDPDGYLYPAKFFFDRKEWGDALRYHQLRLQKIEQSTTLSAEEKKAKVADAYYRIGHLSWAQSYQSPVEFLSEAERQPIIDRGMQALDKAIEISPTAPDPYVYKGLLYLELDKIDPVKHDEHLKMRDQLVEKYKELVKQKQQTDQYMKDLQKEQ